MVPPTYPVAVPDGLFAKKMEPGYQQSVYVNEPMLGDVAAVSRPCVTTYTDGIGLLVWYGMVNVNLYSAIITKVSDALNTLLSEEKPGFQALSKGLILLLCAEVVRQGVPDHGAVHSKCSASNSG